MNKQIENKGYKIKKPFPGNEGLGRVRQIYYKSEIILQVREEENGKYTTLECIKFPSSFSKIMYNVTTEKLIELLDNIVCKNFKEELI